MCFAWVGDDCMPAKIAIIIPAYNAERTVERTVRNVLGQTLRDIEVWVTDDGSHDRTGEILDHLAREDNRLHIIHQKNAGAYAARLNALRRIQTPYFGFVDADDTVESDMYEKMLTAMIREDLDVVQCRLAGQGMDGALRVLTGRDLEDFKFNYLVDARESCFIWDKVYRNQFDFNTFENPDHLTNYDDMIFNFQFFRKISRMGMLDEGLYHYMMTVNSAVHSLGRRQLRDFIWMIRSHLRLSRVLFDSDTSPYLRLLGGHVRWLMRNLKSLIATIILCRFCYPIRRLLAH